jgi:cell division protein ZapA
VNDSGKKKEAVTVRIGGEDHTIRSNAEPDYTRECARMVDERIGEVRRQLGLIESHKAAILAALSITDEFFQMREELEALRGSVRERTDGLTRRLKEGLEEAREPVDTGGHSPGSGVDDADSADETGTTDPTFL